MRCAILLLLACVSIDAALAAEQPIELQRAPGVERVEANCSACHSLDYVQMNSPFLSAASWQAEVNKMINAFGAPIDEADAKIIIEYLVKNYGG
jgi:mono/diheme cytochrome c family protein